jgi:hypothetical protein
MFNKKILIILLIKLHLALALKSANFCILKQKVCKGYYDTKQNYQTKCDLVECSDERFKCSKDICSNNKTECNKYRKLNSNMFILIGKQAALNPKKTDQYFEERKSLQIFNKNLQVCKNKIYKFEKNDFCVNGVNCVEKIISSIGLGYNYVNKRIYCKCPNEKSFKCAKYCTKDSSACDYSKLNNNNKTFISNINSCNNGNVSFLRSFFFSK